MLACGMAEAMPEDIGSRAAATRMRVLPETELLDELDAQEDLADAKRFAYRAREAAEELCKMGPVVAELGDRIHGLAEGVEETVAFLEGRSYFEVTLHAPRVRARSEQEAMVNLGEEAALTSWEPVLEIDAEIQRIPWTEES